jgi:hypothetical protein
MTYPRIASLKTAAAFRSHLERSGIPIAFDDRLDAPAASPLAQPIDVDGVTVGNRFCILPMEGWDGTRDGEPSDLTRRRWRNFGISGAKLMWGGEAVAVRHDGRANPNQLMMSPNTAGAIASLRDELVPIAISTSACSSRIRAGTRDPTSTTGRRRSPPARTRSSIGDFQTACACSKTRRSMRSSTTSWPLRAMRATEVSGSWT